MCRKKIEFLTFGPKFEILSIGFVDAQHCRRHSLFHHRGGLLVKSKAVNKYEVPAMYKPCCVGVIRDGKGLTGSEVEHS